MTIKKQWMRNILQAFYKRDMIFQVELDKMRTKRTIKLQNVYTTTFYL